MLEAKPILFTIIADCYAQICNAYMNSNLILCGTIDAVINMVVQV